ncbi:MAG: hypothetical protein ACP5D2_03765 [Candidatus Nanoarchaeia archaeon]
MKNKTNKRWYFLLMMVIIYLAVMIISSALFNNSLNFFFNILKTIIPVFVVVFIIMIFTNYFITPNFVKKHLMEKGMKKWVFVIIGGILSHGAIYMWYPLLADLHKKGLSYGLIACFLYNRAIKLPLIPLLLFYFNLTYVIIIGFLMILMSIIEGIVIDKILVNTAN